MGAKLIGTGVVLLLGIGFAVYRMRASDAADQNVDVMHERCVYHLQKMSVFSQNKDFFREWDPAAHEHAFDAAYSGARRRRAASFDAKKYATVYFDLLLKQARALEKKGLDQPLREAQVAAEKDAEKL